MVGFEVGGAVDVVVVGFVVGGTDAVVADFEADGTVTVAVVVAGEVCDIFDAVVLTL